MEVDPSAETVIALVAEGMQHERSNDITGAIAIYERALARLSGLGANDLLWPELDGGTSAG